MKICREDRRPPFWSCVEAAGFFFKVTSPSQTLKSRDTCFQPEAATKVCEALALKACWPPVPGLKLVFPIIFTIAPTPESTSWIPAAATAGPIDPTHGDVATLPRFPRDVKLMACRSHENLGRFAWRQRILWL